MADLKTIYRAARYHEPLRDELTPVQNVFFEVCQGPANAPLAWGAILAAIGALLFVGIVRLSVPSSIKVVSDQRGAEVLVDGMNRGETPVVIKDLPRGRHTIEVRKEGYQVKVLTADIGAFSQRAYLANLLPVPKREVVEAQQEAKPQSLGEIFMVKGEEKLSAKKPDTSKKAKAVASRKSTRGVRIASR